MATVKVTYSFCRYLIELIEATSNVHIASLILNVLHHISNICDEPG